MFLKFISTLIPGRKSAEQEADLKGKNIAAYFRFCLLNGGFKFRLSHKIVLKYVSKDFF